MTTALDLTEYKALSFDCYGTLIDWEAGIAAVLAPWGREQRLDLSDEDLLLPTPTTRPLSRGRPPQRSTPTSSRPPSVAPGTGFQRPVSDEWAQRLGNSVPDWPAFPDSADALARLARHYQLIILSNVHRDGFAGSNRRLHGDFAAIITAEDVGAYKPADNHFRALDTTLPKLGVDRTELLHVAQSLFHDHVPAKREGLPSAWINRRHDRPGWGATPEPTEQWTYNLEFNSVGDFADAVDQAFGDAQRTNG